MMKEKVLLVLASIAAKRADGRASEFGVYQPKRPMGNKS